MGDQGPLAPPPDATPPPRGPLAPPPDATPPPPRGGAPADFFRERWCFLVIGLVVGGLIGAGIGAAGSGKGSPAGPAVVAVSAPVSVPPGVTPEPTSPSPFFSPIAEPSPDASYSKSCDYLLGDFSEHTATGFRFVAGAEITNDGNVGLVVDVKATFKQLGSNPIVLKKTARVGYNQTKQVGFTKEVGQDEIDLIQAAQDQGDICDVVVTVTGTFGTVH